MATRHRIDCIKKRQHQNPHERIPAIVGINADQTRWKLSESEAIDAIEERRYAFYVSVGGRTVDVIIAQHSGRKYLKTNADAFEPNNLLSLPECL